ncbi:hypothetical protein K466DRAFT_137502 [Polyporus arcularius HHB13444]|uniref:Uncharacterized protein n=1 Tax=Polyporus arcularius HHB13444 TaxID=1314778 RepID=A0A5C3PUC2_9APHY|nr:hypothetical protein K466DRAFT_137502 [Polyporus arcularius HHB13444]
MYMAARPPRWKVDQNAADWTRFVPLCDSTGREYTQMAWVQFVSPHSATANQQAWATLLACARPHLSRLGQRIQAHPYITLSLHGFAVGIQGWKLCHASLRTRPRSRLVHARDWPKTGMGSYRGRNLGSDNQDASSTADERSGPRLGAGAAANSQSSQGSVGRPEALYLRCEFGGRSSFSSTTPLSALSRPAEGALRTLRATGSRGL